jgi:hypothetical protein
MMSSLNPSPYLGHKRGPKKTPMELADWGRTSKKKEPPPAKFITDPTVLYDESFSPLVDIEKQTKKRENKLTNEIIQVKNVAFEISKFEGMVFDDFELEKARVEKQKAKLKEFLTSKDYIKHPNMASITLDSASYNYDSNRLSGQSASVATTNTSAFNKRAGSVVAEEKTSLPDLSGADRQSDPIDTMDLKPLYRLVISELLADKKNEENEKRRRREMFLAETKKIKSRADSMKDLNSLKAKYNEDIPFSEGIDFKNILAFGLLSPEFGQSTYWQLLMHHSTI